ncbi:TetR/AcrR family transcriptional regulator [bacterium]|nr:TetR/AcrR family transcriptional regulator [bacterium]MBU1025744.1 TetR/AcrR family transcriptional regulator [bacterium]
MVKQKPKSRKEKEQEQRSNYILTMAEELFSEHGYENTSMAMIAEKSEFSVGTVYNFFPSKSDIYSELLMRKMIEMIDGVQEITERSTDSLEKLKMIFEFHVEMTKKNIQFFKIYYSDVDSFRCIAASNIGKKVQNLHHKIVEPLEKIICDAQKKGSLRSDISARKILLTFRIISKAYLQLAIIDPDEFNSGNPVVEMFDIFMNGMGK